MKWRPLSGISCIVCAETMWPTVLVARSTSGSFARDHHGFTPVADRQAESRTSVRPTSKVSASMTSDRKPARCGGHLDRARWNAATRYRPSASAATVPTNPLAPSRTVIVAPGRTASEMSSTTPLQGAGRLGCAGHRGAHEQHGGEPCRDGPAAGALVRIGGGRGPTWPVGTAYRLEPVGGVC